MIECIIKWFLVCIAYSPIFYLMYLTIDSCRDLDFGVRDRVTCKVDKLEHVTKGNSYIVYGIFRSYPFEVWIENDAGEVAGFHPGYFEIDQAEVHRKSTILLDRVIANAKAENRRKST